MIVHPLSLSIMGFYYKNNATFTEIHIEKVSMQFYNILIGKEASKICFLIEYFDFAAILISLCLSSNNTPCAKQSPACDIITQSVHARWQRNASVYIHIKPRYDTDVTANFRAYRQYEHGMNYTSFWLIRDPKTADRQFLSGCGYVIANSSTLTLPQMLVLDISNKDMLCISPPNVNIYRCLQ